MNEVLNELGLELTKVFSFSFRFKSNQINFMINDFYKKDLNEVERNLEMGGKLICWGKNQEEIKKGNLYEVKSDKFQNDAIWTKRFKLVKNQQI